MLKEMFTHGLLKENKNIYNNNSYYKKYNKNSISYLLALERNDEKEARE